MIVTWTCISADCRRSNRTSSESVDNQNLFETWTLRGPPPIGPSNEKIVYCAHCGAPQVIEFPNQ